MKPARFSYHAPATLTEVLDLLAEHGDEARPLAGGQSLMPLLNMRLATVGHLVDLNGVVGLTEISETNGQATIGALVRQRCAELSPALPPLLRAGIGHIAHPVIRNRGTVVGSVAHADPAGELPALLCALGGEVTLRSRSSVRAVAAEDFFVGWFQTARRPDELVVSVTVPSAAATEATGYGFEEIARRHGDYAMCGAGVSVCPERSRVSLFGVGATPHTVDVTGEVAAGDLAAAVESVASGLSPVGDIHASSGYRLRLARVVTRRALEAARRSVGGEIGDG